MWIRLRQVALVAAELEPVVEDLRAVLGLEVAFRDPGVARFGLENAVLPIGTQFLEVVAPVEAGTAAGRYLDRRHGDGGYMVITHTDDHPARQARVDALGVRKVLDYEHDGYRCMQLHPADTGGSFLEIDFQPGGDDPQGPWQPAGPAWQGAARTNVVDGIEGVEIQAADPDQVAQRWSDVTEISLQRNGAGAAPVTLPLDNATIAFVPLGDDRGDGLSGLRLTAVDERRARAEAKQRGRLDDDGAVVICGTRFQLVPA
ncbi:MAG: VOC family protein [Acidimicrobiaceae bacterium]|nr:VOC family protein [Acidimicrobiaceae bacterium]